MHETLGSVDAVSAPQREEQHWVESLTQQHASVAARSAAKPGFPEHAVCSMLQVAWSRLKKQQLLLGPWTVLY